MVVALKNRSVITPIRPLVTEGKLCTNPTNLPIPTRLEDHGLWYADDDFVIK